MKKAALVLVALLVLAPAAGAKAKRVTLSGKVASGGQSLAGMRIIALPTGGLAAIAPIRSDGTFSLKLDRSAVKGASLQLLTRAGTYSGPVLLRKVGQRGATRLAAVSGAKLRLGTIRLAAGYASATLAKARVLTARAKTVRLVAGVPAGAGNVGLVAASGRASRAGGACATERSAEAGAGGDCDQDGVPNAIDVDDNGNRSLDAVDAQSSGTTAQIAIMNGLRPSLQQTSNVYVGATPTTINAALGDIHSSGALGLGFWLDQHLIDGTTATPFDAVWIDCPAAMTWCGGASPTATASGMSEFPKLLPSLADFERLPWSSYTGSVCRSGTCTAYPAANRHPNALAEVYPSYGGGGGGGVPLPVWSVGMSPESDDTLGVVQPGSVLTVNALAGGVVTSLPVSLAPYYVTSPVITSFASGGATTTLDYTGDRSTLEGGDGHPYVLGSGNLLTLRFLRPQRFALPGEAGDFYDVTGMHWGLTLDQYDGTRIDMSLGEFGCPVSAPTGLTAASYYSDGGSDAARINAVVPYRDSTTVDYATDAGSPPAALGFTVDIGTCVANAHQAVAAGKVARVTLQGWSEPVSGGKDSTDVSFSVELG